MANKKMKDVRNLTADELRTKIRESEAAVFDSRLKLATGQLEDTAKIWRQRKELNRMKFMLASLSAAKAQKATKTEASAKGKK
ncbi:MAG: 50S ribosomal protein L29 [Bacteriovoracia bacterium]